LTGARFVVFVVEFVFKTTTYFSPNQDEVGIQTPFFAFPLIFQSAFLFLFHAVACLLPFHSETAPGICIERSWATA
jgi:hypothetical protein